MRKLHSAMMPPPTQFSGGMQESNNLGLLSKFPSFRRARGGYPTALKLMLTSFILFYFLVSSYAQFTVSTVNTNPYCNGDANGSVRITASAGTAPYTFQQILPTVGTIMSSSNPHTFTGLTGGIYRFRVVDALGNIEVRDVSLINPVASNFNFSVYSRLQNLVCDSIDLRLDLTGISTPNYKVEFWDDQSPAAGNGASFAPVGLPVRTFNGITAFNTTFRVPMGPSGRSIKVVVTDSCGRTLNGANFRSSQTLVPEYLNGQRTSGNVCNTYDYQTEFAGLTVPVTFNLFSGSTATGPIVQTVTQNSILNRGHGINYQVGGTFTNLSTGTYTMTATDACGKLLTRTFNFIVPTPKPILAVSSCGGSSTLDSTGVFYAEAGTMTVPFKLRVLSGPSTYTVTGASAYANTNIIYPITRTGLNNGSAANPFAFSVTNMPEGTYRIQVEDACNNVYDTTVTITNSMLRAYGLASYTIVPGCLNANKLVVNIAGNCGNNSPVLRNSSGTQIDVYNAGTTAFRDSTINLPSGNYNINFEYGQGAGNMDSVLNVGGYNGSLVRVPGTVIKTQPIFIPPYTGATVDGTLLSPCPNTGTGTVVAKPKGIQPYTFELLGPVGNNNILRTSQTDSTFSNLPLTDSFRVRVTDGCGNSTVSSNISFQGIAVNAGTGSSLASCLLIGGTATLIADDMGAATYAWSGPNGYSATGRTATRNLTSLSDSGLYKVVTTSITGCKDSAYVRLSFKPNAGTDVTINCNVNTSVTLSGTPAAGTWSAQTGNPAGATLTGTSVSFTTSATGTYNFIYTLNGCTDTIAVAVTAKPTAGVDKTVDCFANGVATMTGTGTGTWTAQSSNLGTATIATPTSATTTISGFSAAGTYNFIFTNNGCTDTVTVTVGSACTCPIANNSIVTTSSTQCAPFAGVTINGTTATPLTNTSYQWQVNNGSGWVNATGASTVEDYATGALAAGAYQYRRIFIHTGVPVCRDTTAPITVTINAKPNAGADITGVCGGSIQALTATPAGGVWTAQTGNPTGATLTGSNVTFTTAATGSYNFIYTLNGCSDTVAVAVNAKPNAGTDVLYACGTQPASSNLVGTPVGGAWTALASNPIGASLAGAVVTLPVAPATGTWSFVYTVNGCTDTTNIVIGSASGSPTIGVNMGTNPICLNGTVQLCPTVWGWANYQWYRNGVAIAAPAGTSACITLDSTGVGSYTLAGTTGTGCWSAQSAPIVVTYNRNCSATPTPTPSCSSSWYSQNATVNCDSTLSFIANGTNPVGTTYSWTFGDGTTGTGTPVTHKYATTGAFMVKLVVTNGTCKDSTAYNVYVSNCSVTGGGGGGIESKTLGNVISQRLYGKSISNQSQTLPIPTQGFTKNTTAILNGPSDLKLSDLIPANVFGTDRALISTPTDLINFTNALEVLSVDYTKSTVNKAVAFATRTAGDVYSHTKPICDRLRGAELMEVKTMNINGYNVMAYQIRQRTGEVEYAMNLNAGVKSGRSTISVQSNWFTNSYVQDETMFNFQLWAVSYDMVGTMAKDIITKLQQQGSVNSVTPTDLPRAYVSKGNRAGTKVNLTVQNNTASTVGYFELKEKQNEGSVETVRTVPFTLGANKATTVELPVQDYYEGSMYMYVGGKLTDLVYLSDGTWSLDYNKNNTTIGKFNVQNETNPQEVAGEYRLMRNVNVTGTTKDYISVYKTINGGGIEQNLSGYKGIKFTTDAVGVGQLKVTIIRKGIQNWNDQYSYSVNLEGTSKEYAIGLSQFKSNRIATAINANDVLGVSFSYNNVRGGNTNATINLSKVRFTTVDVAAQTAMQSKTVSVYPNPVSAGQFTASFMSEADQTVVLRVVEIATGKTVKAQFVQAKKGTNQVSVQLQTATNNGMYSVQVQSDNGNYEAQKLMINKK